MCWIVGDACGVWGENRGGREAYSSGEYSPNDAKLRDVFRDDSL